MAQSSAGSNPNHQRYVEVTVDEATPRIQEALAELQGLSPAAVMTEAHRLAQKAIKAQWQAQGRKVHWIEHSELVRAARTYLDLHRAELINQARANLNNSARGAKP